MFRILVVNPGGTSTKIALYHSDKELFSADVRHVEKFPMKFGSIKSLLGNRLRESMEVIAKNGIDLKEVDAVVGRGGPVAPLESGTYIVDSPMLEAIIEGRVMVHHPSLLGALLANELAKESGCEAFVVDPVSVDELSDEARITGMPRIERKALSHALSLKAAAREASIEIGNNFEQTKLIVMHLGSGISVAVSKNGRQVDSTDASSSGPMAPTRAGSVPALDLVRLCYSGEFTLEQMENLMVGWGGWMAHMGTDDLRKIYERIDGGDGTAKTVLEATIYQICKETAAMASVLAGEVDAIVITGGIAKSERFLKELLPRLRWICEKQIIYPGEREMLALARGAARVLAKEYTPLSMKPYIERYSTFTSQERR